jgi:hypothetical protein
MIYTMFLHRSKPSTRHMNVTRASLSYVVNPYLIGTRMFLLSAKSGSLRSREGCLVLTTRQLSHKNRLTDHHGAVMTSILPTRDSNNVNSRKVPVPTPHVGEVLVRVNAYGLWNPGYNPYMSQNIQNVGQSDVVGTIVKVTVCCHRLRAVTSSVGWPP